MGRFTYSDEDLDLIVASVEKYKNIIENKRTTKASQDAKYQAWENIALEVRLYDGVRPVSAKQIKKCWENLKARARQEKRDEDCAEYKMLEVETTFHKRLEKVRSIIGGHHGSSSNSNADCNSNHFENFIGIDNIDGEGGELSDPIIKIDQDHLEGLEESSDDPLEILGNTDHRPVIQQFPEVNPVNQANTGEHVRRTYNVSRARNKLALRRARRSHQEPYNSTSPTTTAGEKIEHTARLNLLKQKMDLDLREHEARMEILKLEKSYWEAKVTQALLDTRRSVT